MSMSPTRLSMPSRQPMMAGRLCRVTFVVLSEVPKLHRFPFVSRKTSN
jgi:hypothetical protein